MFDSYATTQESKRFLETVTVLPVRRAGVASSSEGSDELVRGRGTFCTQCRPLRRAQA